MSALDEPFYNAFKSDRTAPRSLYLEGDFMTQAMGEGRTMADTATDEFNKCHRDTNAIHERR